MLRPQSTRVVGDGTTAVMAFREALNKPDFADVIFKMVSKTDSASDKSPSQSASAAGALTTTHTIHAHRCILAARSPVFREMFFGGYPESRQKEVIVDDFKYEHFMTILEWAYTGTAQMTARDVLGVLQAANFYGLDDLMSECRDLAQSFIDEENVLHLLEHASGLGETSLVVQCLGFIKSHAHAVLGSPVWLHVSAECVERVLTLPAIDCEEALLFEHCMSWLESNTTLIADIAAAVKANSKKVSKIKKQQQQMLTQATTVATAGASSGKNTGTIKQVVKPQQQPTAAAAAAAAAAASDGDAETAAVHGDFTEQGDEVNAEVSHNDEQQPHDDDAQHNEDDNNSDDDEEEIFDDDDDDGDDGDDGQDEDVDVGVDDEEANASGDDETDSKTRTKKQKKQSTAAAAATATSTLSMDAAAALVGHHSFPSAPLVRRFFRHLRLSHLSVSLLLDRVRPLLLAHPCVRPAYVAALEFLVSPGHINSVTQVPRAPTALSTVQIDVPAEFLRGWKHVVSIPQVNTGSSFGTPANAQLIPNSFFSEVPAHAAYVCAGEMVLGREDAISVVAVGCIRLVRPIIGSRTPVVAEDGDICWHASPTSFGFTPRNGDAWGRVRPAQSTPSARAQAGVRFMVATAPQTQAMAAGGAALSAPDDGQRHGKRFIYYK